MKWTLYPILGAPKDGPVATRSDEPDTVVVARLFLAFERASEHPPATRYDVSFGWQPMPRA